MRFKIKEYTWDEKTGITTMLASCKYGDLYAETRCHESDKELQNHWDGSRFCEYKIAIQFMRHRVRELYDRMNGARDALWTVYTNMVKNGTLTDCAWDILLLLQNQVDGYEKEWKRVRNQYHEFKDNYKPYCNSWLNNRKNLRKRIEEQKKEEE